MAVYDPRGTSPLHMDAILTQISVGWPNGDFVGPNFFPSVGVRKQTDKYYVFGRESWGLHPGGDIRAPGTVANEITGINVSTDTYFAVEHALQIAVTDEEKETVDSPMQPVRDGTELVTSQVHLGRELAIRNLMVTAANYATGMSVTLAGTDQWSDFTNSDPIDDVKVARMAMHAKIFVEPNTILLPYQVIMKLEDHPDFIERIKYSERGIVSRDLLSTLFGGMRIVTPGVGYNSSNPGQAAALGYIWGKDVVMAYVPPRPGLKVPAYGYEFTWNYPSGGPQAVERWREEPRKSEIIRVGRRYDLKLVAKDDAGKSIAGYLIKNAVA
jgi:hypothetical protein